MIVSIDGPAGSGKSSVASALSQKLNFIHFNSGSLYRAIAVYLKSINFDFFNLNENANLPTIELKCELISGVQNVFVNSLNTTPNLRDDDISLLSAKCAKNKYVRELVDDCQRKFCLKHDVIIEGRDIGSHVFPNAEHKFYLDCSVDERANRRFLEEKAKGNNITMQRIKSEIIERDFQDKTRKIAPLVIPQNAIIIDSTNLSIAQVVDLMYSNIKKT